MKEPLGVNRAAALLVPKKPFFDWLRSLPDPMELSPAMYEEYSTVYLLPEFEDDVEKRDVLRICFTTLFEEVLVGWWTVEDDWPDTRHFKIFTDWFDVKMYSMVLDTVEAPLERGEH
jgi:hypothetical protein